MRRRWSFVIASVSFVQSSAAWLVCELEHAPLLGQPSPSGSVAPAVGNGGTIGGIYTNIPPGSGGGGNGLIRRPAYTLGGSYRCCCRFPPGPVRGLPVYVCAGCSRVWEVSASWSTPGPETFRRRAVPGGLRKSLMRYRQDRSPAGPRDPSAGVGAGACAWVSRSCVAAHAWFCAAG
jgi:hypothetical protein